MNYTESINSAPTVLIEFYASWCPHCRHMMPIVEQITELLEGKAKVYQYDIDKHSDISYREKVETIPTFIIYSNGKEKWRHSGEIDGQILLNKVESYTDTNIE